MPATEWVFAPFHVQVTVVPLATRTNEGEKALSMISTDAWSLPDLPLSPQPKANSETPSITSAPRVNQPVISTSE